MNSLAVPPLDVEEFDAYFREVHGVDPFPWQSRLAHNVCQEGWPEALDVPTGAGKTAALDVAVFHLAVEAHRGAARNAPVRVLFVVDRRLVVDDAHRRATRLADALVAATDGVLLRVADRLRLLSEQRSRPLVVGRLRGGVPNDVDWVRSPAQPAVIASTVDQVGSRYFFRGYGVSDSMRPVHAGLVGADALVLLDEAHLSQPFFQSAQDSRIFQTEKTWSDDRCPALFSVVTLSATQSENARALLDGADREHETLGPRLKCTKPTELVAVKSNSDEPRFDAEFVDRAWRVSTLGGGPARVVAVVVNRVKRARGVFDSLRERIGSREVQAGDAALLTGRSRPLDRDRLVEQILPRMAAQRAPNELSNPLFVVATQCVEAGADLDFDALVTEIAPIDSLRQRFGRLNRMGRRLEVAAAILAAKDQVSARSEPDWVYGDALKTTWRLLTDRAEVRGRGKRSSRVIDFGSENSREWLPEGKELSELLAPRADAPVLLEPAITHWTCTSPRPSADADVALYLHGPNAGPGDVLVVWRADLDPDDRPDSWIPLLAACPPSSLEALALPIAEVRRWLGRGATGDIADVEAGRDEEPQRGREALRWRGPDDERTGSVNSRSVRPGDLVVVPASWGGCDRWGWVPGRPAAVRDLAREANRIQRGRDILRLSTRIAETVLTESGVDRTSGANQLLRMTSMLDTLLDASEAEVLSTLRESTSLPASWREWAAEPDNTRVVRATGGRPLALERRVESGEVSGVSSTEDDLAAAGRKAVPLSAHLQGVRAVALDFATKLGLPQDVVDDIALAALLHDTGKAHPDFKLRMYGGDELGAAIGEPLAKSGRAVLPGGRQGLPPRGARHEVASLALARAHPRLPQSNDPELVLWLIGTHHGHGRPFFPPVVWPEPGTRFEAAVDDVTVRSEPVPAPPALASEWLDLHERLNRRYGPWGLARLEALVRLADHRRSEMEVE